ncbi:peptidylprolyl isomerase [Luteolibacter sp. AS25]|uniref:peptidylprolyl isomerase n=1 Tax=Luteolibacter sp. AS25 TaxID=3135776 RepID=UPI00398B1FBE
MIRHLAYFLTPALLATSALTKPVEVNSIAATVEGQVITSNEVNFMMAPVFAQLITKFPRGGPEFEKQFKESRNKVLEELVDRQIILSEFKRLGATIPAYAIDQEIDRQIRELYNGNKSRFQEELKKSRLTMPGYREMTREKMIVQAMRAEQFSDAPPPLPNEVQNEYNKVKTELRDTSKDKISFRKIFIPSMDPEAPLATPESQLTLSEDIAKQINNGADFEELAKTHSRDAFATEGGYQENVPRIDLSPEFASIVFDANIGQVIGPLLDPRGFTIVKIVGKNLGPSPSLSEVRPMIEERVRRNKTSKQYDRWMDTRRKRAMIKIND